MKVLKHTRFNYGETNQLDIKLVIIDDEFWVAQFWGDILRGGSYPSLELAEEKYNIEINGTSKALEHIYNTYQKTIII